MLTNITQHYTSRTFLSAPSKTTSSLCSSAAPSQRIALVSARNVRMCSRLIRCGRGKKRIQRLVGVTRLLLRLLSDEGTPLREQIWVGE